MGLWDDMDEQEEKERADKRAYDDWSNCGYICSPVESDKEAIDRHIKRKSND